MNKGIAGVLFAAGLLVAGCSGFSKEAQERNPAPCPSTIALIDAARAIEFEGEERLDDIAYTAEIINVSSQCRYFADKPIDATVEIDFAFGKGPKGANGEKYFKYFVAVTRKDLEVIAKSEFVIPVEFGEKRTIVVKSDEIDKIIIPRMGEEISGANFEIVVGFILTPEQAIFNRSGKSLKFPNIQ